MVLSCHCSSAQPSRIFFLFWIFLNHATCTEAEASHAQIILAVPNMRAFLPLLPLVFHHFHLTPFFWLQGRTCHENRIDRSQDSGKCVVFLFFLFVTDEWNEVFSEFFYLENYQRGRIINFICTIFNYCSFWIVCMSYGRIFLNLTAKERISLFIYLIFMCFFSFNETTKSMSSTQSD